jgi:hypothetical protein
MKKTQKPDRQTAAPVQEKDLRFTMGGVDNPGQTAMKDDGH